MSALSRLLRARQERAAPAALIERLGGQRDGESAAALDGIVHLLFDDAPFGLMVVDRTGHIIRVNDALRRMVGRGVNLARQAPAELVFAADTRAAAWNEVAPVLSGRLHVSRDFATRLEGSATGGDPDDPWNSMVSVSIAVLREADGTVSGALLRISDITLQKQLEAQLAQSQKLQAVGQLAGGIAHDFNNLLTAVLGAADSIATREGLDAETLEDAAQIGASAQRGAALVRQLLAFGRQQTLQPCVLAVNDAITDVTALLRRLLGSKIRLELDLEMPGRSVRVDPTQLDQVLVNLAVNARDAMGEGGVLTLRSGHMTLYRPLARGPETIPPGRYVMIEVRDTGAGIPPDVLPRIFDPFFTTKRDKGGNGLGLSTVHGIVRQSDGFLAVESELGIGTRVRVYLPRWDGQEAVAIPRIPETSQEAGSAAPSSVRGVVLLVDDEEPVRRLAERTLVRHGWRVLAAESGEAALALLHAEARPGVSALVTDMVMPGMDGVALVRAVRAQLGAPRLPAILVSGYAEATLRRDLDAAETAFLPKPYSLKDLAAKLDEITCMPAVP